MDFRAGARNVVVSINGPTSRPRPVKRPAREPVVNDDDSTQKK